MTRTELTATERALVRTSIVRLRARVTAVVFGMAGGVGLLAATLWLMVRGGPQVGKHLTLLNNYFPGYEVSWLGGLIGMFYGGLACALIGWALASVYNFLVDRRVSK
jgi:hypothetical protein